MLAALLLLCAPAHGSEPTPASGAGATEAASRDVAKHHYRKGVEAYDAGQYVDAVEHFEKADRLHPSAALSFNIARAHHELGADARALSYYRDYLRRDPDAQDAPVVKSIIEKLESELAAKGVQQVSVLSAPAGATVIIDDEPRGVTPWTGELDPGKHHVTLQLRGYEDIERQFTLPREDALEVSVRFTPSPVRSEGLPSGPRPALRMDVPRSASTRGPRSSPEPVERPRAESSSSALAIAGWSTLGLGLASLGGAITFEVLRAKSEDRADTASTQVEAENETETMESRRDLARIFGITGGVLTVGGGALLTIDAVSDSSDDPKDARLMIRCSPFKCGLEGQFQ